MKNIIEISGEIQRADQRLQQHADRIARQSQSICEVMQNIQSAFGDQNSGQMAVMALNNAIESCSRADSTLYRARNHLNELMQSLSK